MNERKEKNNEDEKNNEITKWENPNRKKTIEKIVLMIPIF